MELWTPRTTVAAIVEDRGRFLMVEERDRDGRLVLNQPAGHLEDAESIADDARREVLEETSWEFRPDGLLGVYKWRIPSRPLTYVRYCFFGSAVTHHPDRPLDADILRAVWMSEGDIMKQHAHHRSPMVARCLRDYVDGRRFPLEMICEMD